MAKNGGDSELALLTVDMVVELKNWIKFRLAHILLKSTSTEQIGY